MLGHHPFPTELRRAYTTISYWVHPLFLYATGESDPKIKLFCEDPGQRASNALPHWIPTTPGGGCYDYAYFTEKKTPHQKGYIILVNVKRIQNLEATPETKLFTTASTFPYLHPRLPSCCVAALEVTCT